MPVYNQLQSSLPLPDGAIMNVCTLMLIKNLPGSALLYTVFSFKCIHGHTYTNVILLYVQNSNVLRCDLYVVVVYM